jgi:hypothetical protein
MEVWWGEDGDGGRWLGGWLVVEYILCFLFFFDLVVLYFFDLVIFDTGAIFLEVILGEDTVPYTHFQRFDAPFYLLLFSYYLYLPFL